MRVKYLIISACLLIVMLGTGIALYCAWPAITGTITNNSFYTSEDLQESYDNGFEDGCNNFNELTEQVDYYKDLTDTYYTQILDYKTANATLQTSLDSLKEQKISLETQVNNLTIANNSNKELLNELNTQKISLELQIDDLQTIKFNNEKIIVEKETKIKELQQNISDLENVNSNNIVEINLLKSEISKLNNEVAVLKTDNLNKDNQISSLSSQVVSLQNLNLQLQTTNELNLQTINNLNNQISSLNTQISDMTLNIQNNSTNVNSLNNKISELEKSIAYYQQYISSLETENKVVATFEFNGSVYNIQILNKNDSVSVTNPTSTEYIIFNGWKVNGEFVDLNFYSVTTNTTFIADVTYKYDVRFMVDGGEYNSQTVIQNGYATLPTSPTKTGYAFDGWTTNGVDIVTPNTIAVASNITFVAKFTKLHSVTFVYEDTILSTQTIRNNEYATNVNVDNTTYKVFNGWTKNGVVVDIANTKIVADSTFVANITYKYDVKFIVDGSEYNSQIVIQNGYATIPTIPTKTGYAFDGWTTNGVDIVTPNTIAVASNITFVAKFTKLHSVTFVYEDTTLSTQTIRHNEYANNVNAQNTTYKVFNGWSVDGSIVNISNYPITSDTTFVADVTYKYDVDFYVDGGLYNNQVITSGSCATEPALPTKDNYNFIGWSLDNVEVVDVSTIIITEDTVFYSIWESTGAYLTTGSAFKTKIGTSVTSVVFDTYSNGEYGTYLVDGTNVIANVTPVDVTSSDSANTIELYSVGTNAYVLSTSNILANATCYRMFYGCTVLTSIVFNNFDTSNVTSMSGMFYNCKKLTNLNLSKFNTSSVTTMQNMFYNCNALSSIDVSGFNTENVKDMSSMFYGCNAVTGFNLSNFNTNSLTTMSGMFQNCSALTSIDLSNFNTSNVTNMATLFYNCSALTSIDLSNFNTSNVKYMQNMFNYCSVLPSINLSHFDTSSVSNMSYMFAGCKILNSLDLRNFNTVNVTNMSYMFSVCHGLSYLNITSFDTSNVTNMTSMFNACKSLTSLDVSSFNTSKVTDMTSMFGTLENITSLDISNFDTSSVKNMNLMFNGCSLLSRIYVSDLWSTSSVTSSSKMFTDCVNVPNYISSTVDASKAFYGGSGYLTFKAN